MQSGRVGDARVTVNAVGSEGVKCVVLWCGGCKGAKREEGAIDGKVEKREEAGNEVD